MFKHKKGYQSKWKNLVTLMPPLNKKINWYKNTEWLSAVSRSEWLLFVSHYGVICHAERMRYYFLRHIGMTCIFSSPESKIQWWAYRIGRPLSSVCMCVCVVGMSKFSNIFSSETTGLIKAKFHMEPSWNEGTKVCSNGPGHMTKLGAMPIYGKNLKKSSSPEPKSRWPWNFVCCIGC